MARDRKGAQLSFELPPELLERLRAHALSERRTVAALLRGWIEAGLEGALEPSAALVGLTNRLGALERDVAQLKLGAIKATRRQQRPGLLPAVKVSDSGGSPPDPPASADQVIPAPPAGGAITTVELAERTGTSRPGWNNWAARATLGDVRDHPQAGSWRLAGKASASGGGPERWLWEKA